MGWAEGLYRHFCKDIQISKKHMKLLIIIKMQSQTTVRHHLTPVKMAIIKSKQIIDVGKGMEKWYPPTLLIGMQTGTATMRAVWKFVKKLKRELLYDPANPVLVIYPQKNIARKHTCMPMFITALFTIAETWKQCNRLSYQMK